ncbi:hypothetical protein MATR_15130 [Marivirga tractuosa]|uniref:Uncharacterized protein n=1 Tax=Marivirga tractuosa (strain ATCC 23168 / DSM 4126 / NBRC 15989 / NCIMB 1408 / VKM B-1430 / H-43) TaxID=643867 RepID=E4TT13_MARTH|nr:hypothetical protein [Marivirga tractuosa]ADR20861.1 hypothetical protein Ftrac_0859 [Marivirga tractuosa DSM 4126]BDD14688.1 hypothetical protein MATR_15130 [Marivirga tractuosa]
MEKLADDWITSGTLDFEYKKYILLAYLKHVAKSFDQHKLYPSFADLIMHYKNASQLKAGKQQLWKSFPKELTKLDLKNFRLFFESKVNEDDQLKELEEIVDFAMDSLQGHIAVGKNIFDEVEKQLIIEPVGIKALEENEGLLLIDPQYDPFYHIYQYRISIFEAAEEKVRGLQTVFIDRIKKSIGTTLEQLKIQVLKNIKLVSNYSAFRVVALQPYPYEETLLPIVKRSFSGYLENNFK